MKGATIFGLTVAGSIAAIGALHVPATQEILGLRCPFKAAEPARDTEAIRAAATQRLAIGDPAAAHPAGPLDLAGATRADLFAAATAAGLTCGTDARGLTCAPAAADDSRRWFAELDAHDALVALVMLEYVGDPASALARLDGAVATVEAQVGAPTHERHDDLAAGALRQARVDFRRQDYFAQLSATHLRDDRYLVAETYRAIR